MNAEKRRLIHTWFDIYKNLQDIPEDSPHRMTFDGALVMLRDKDTETILKDIQFMRSVKR